MNKQFYQDYVSAARLVKVAYDNNGLQGIEGLDLAIKLKESYSSIGTSISRLLFYTIDNKTPITKMQADAINMLLTLANKEKDIPLVHMVLSTMNASLKNDVVTSSTVRKEFKSFYPDCNLSSVNSELELDNVLGYYGVIGFREWLLLGLTTIVGC